MEFFIVGLLCATFYLLNSFLLNYWKRRNFPQMDTTFLLGNLGELFKASMGEGFANLYEKTKSHKFIGFYLSYKPSLLINDPELIRNVMIKDFSTFHDRSMPSNEGHDIMSGSLFSLGGHRWRELRVKLTPIFTSGKLKMMFPILKNCGSVLTEHITSKNGEGKNIFDVHDLFGRFTINIISSVAFGVDNDCINEPDHIFRKIGLEIFDEGIVQKVRFFIIFFLPQLYHLFKIRMTSKRVENYIKSVVRQIIEHREKNNVRRNDFMDLMIQLKNKGFLSGDKESIEQDAQKGPKVIKLTENELMAQTYIFFGAGFETSSSTTTLCFFELCRNPEILQKVQNDIDRVLEAHDNEISYESLNDMKCLECCIDETLRMYPILGMYFRTASRDYQIPETNVVIEKGTDVYIPIMGIQRDSAIFEDSMKFSPDRFIDSSTGNGVSKGLFYMPFGDGPRSCIGARMGKLQAKLGLALTLSKFDCELVDKKLMNKKITFKIGSPSLVSNKKINVKFTPRK